MIPPRRTARAWRITLAILALSAPAFADATTDADDAIRRGVELRRAHDDAAALEEFRRAYALAPTGRARAQMALAEEALGQWAAAEADIQGALRTADAWVDRNRATLESELETIAQHLGTLTVTANVPGAELRVNGRAAGTLPRTLRVEIGEAALEVHAAGRIDAKRVVRVAAGASLEEAFDLSAPPATAPGPTAPGPTPPRPQRTPPPTDTPVASSQRTWGYVALGGAGVALGAGVVANAIRQAHVSRYNDDAVCPPVGRSIACGDERDAANRAATFAVIGYGAAGALAIAGTVLVLTAPRSNVRVGGWLDRGGAGASLGVRF